MELYRYLRIDKTNGMPDISTQEAGLRNCLTNPSMWTPPISTESQISRSNNMIVNHTLAAHYALLP